MDEDTLRARIALWRSRAETATTPFEQAANLLMADHYEILLGRYRRGDPGDRAEAGDEA